MKVHVQLFAQLGAKAGANELRYELESTCTAQELVARLADERGPEVRSMLLDAEGRLVRSVLLFVDERQVRWDEPRELADGAHVLLASPVAGG